MDKVLKREFRFDKKTKVLVIVALIIFCIVSVVTSIKLYQEIHKVVSRQAVESITNISELNVDSVSRAINNNKMLLKTISDNISQRNVDDIDSILKEMKPFVEAYGYYNLGVLTDDFLLYLSNGKTLDVNGRKEFKDAWIDEFTISESYLPKSGGEHMVNMLSYPVKYNGKIKYVLVIALYSKNLTERMNISSMEGKGYNILMDTNGEVVIFPRHYENKDYTNLMEFVNKKPDIIPTDSGNRYFVYHDENYYAHFESMGIKDWYLMTCAKEKDVFENANKIIKSVFTGMGMLWCMIVIALLMTALSIYRSRKRLRAAVYYDELLGIANGNFLPIFFSKIPDDKRNEMVLVIFDIDNFKEFNYIYGEDIGDKLLKYIVRAFNEELPGDYLFRYLADHFVAIVRCEDMQEIRLKLDRLLDRFKRDMDSGEIRHFAISAGIRSLDDNNAFRRIISDALLAKGKVKGNHIQQYAFYDDDLRYKRMKYMALESEFSKALKNNEFKPYYQPKFDMKTGRIVGAEALVRWIKPDGEIISPGEFIPCFEASRQVIMLDEAMLAFVCCQMKQMEKDGIEVQKVSVNLSRVHLRQPGILPKIEKIVKESGVNPAKLSFEITESVLYEDSIPLKNIIDFIHSIGCKVDIDDYGIGVSGPNALASNEFDVVKLDKSFIAGIGDSKIESVIRSTIRLSKDLGIDIIAEGVEEKYQADSLLKWGCRLAQGFYYSPPVSETEYRKMLEQNKKTDNEI